MQLRVVKLDPGVYCGTRAVHVRRLHAQDISSPTCYCRGRLWNAGTRPGRPRCYQERAHPTGAAIIASDWSLLYRWRLLTDSRNTRDLDSVTRCPAPALLKPWTSFRSTSPAVAHHSYHPQPGRGKLLPQQAHPAHEHQLLPGKDCHGYPPSTALPSAQTQAATRLRRQHHPIEAN